MTKIVPIYSEASKHHFVDGYEPTSVLIDGVSVLTAPLKIGDRLSLLGASQHPELEANGSIDLTDSVSKVNAKIDRLVFKLSSGQFVDVQVGNEQGDDFAFHATDTTNYLVLNEAVRVSPLGSGLLVDHKGMPVGVANLPDAVYVHLRGSIQPELSTTEVLGAIQWSTPFLEGEEPPVALVGYYLDVDRANANRRPRVAPSEVESQGTQDHSGSEAEVVIEPAAPALPRVRLEMGSLGVITLELDTVRAPKTAQNFIDYVEAGHYDGLLFHRVIPGFMIQGGGFDRDWKQPVTREEIQNEANNGVKNDKYTLAMARTSAPHSGLAQFFINVADNSFLNHTAPTAQGWGYAVFGKVVDGFDVVDRISKTATGRKGFHDDVPLELVLIEQAVLVKSED